MNKSLRPPDTPGEDVGSLIEHLTTTATAMLAAAEALRAARGPLEEIVALAGCYEVLQPLYRATWRRVALAGIAPRKVAAQVTWEQVTGLLLAHGCELSDSHLRQTTSMHEGTLGTRGHRHRELKALLTAEYLTDAFGRGESCASIARAVSTDPATVSRYAKRHGVADLNRHRQGGRR